MKTQRDINVRGEYDWATDLDYLHKKLKGVIDGVCNEVGCRFCGEDCIATPIQDRIHELEEQSFIKKEPK